MAWHPGLTKRRIIDLVFAAAFTGAGIWTGERAVVNVALFFVGIAVPELFFLINTQQTLNDKLEALPKTLPDEIRRTFKDELEIHATADTQSIARLAELVKLNPAFVAREFGNDTKSFATALATFLEECTKRRTHALATGFLQVMSGQVRSVREHPGIYLSSNHRSKLYSQVGHGAEKWIMRIEPGDVWPNPEDAPDGEKTWSHDFMTTMKDLGRNSHNARRAPCYFVVFATQMELDSNPERRDALVSFLKTNYWRIWWVNSMPVMSGDDRFKPKRFHLNHHFIVDGLVDLIANVEQLSNGAGSPLSISQPRVHRGSVRSATPIESAVFTKVQPPFHANHIDLEDRDQHSNSAFVYQIAARVPEIAKVEGIPSVHGESKDLGQNAPSAE